MLLEYPFWDTQRLSSDYGQRGKLFHYGIDFAASAGTEILGMWEGTVQRTGYDASARGYWIEYLLDGFQINNSNVTVCYFHMLRPTHLKHGDKVRQFNLVGYVGSTGNSTGNHLHLEFRLNYPGAGWESQSRRPDPKPYMYMTSKKERPDQTDPTQELKKLLAPHVDLAIAANEQAIKELYEIKKIISN